MMTRPVAANAAAHEAALDAGRVERALRRIEKRTEVGHDAAERARRAVRIVRSRTRGAEELALSDDPEPAQRRPMRI